MKRKICITISLCLFLLTTCAAEESAGSLPTRITHSQAQSMMADNNPLIIDVRTFEEFANGHIENAILIPVDKIEYLAPILIQDKDTTLLVYCRTGRRSSAAVLTLAEIGFTSVYDFGGILNWDGEIIVPAFSQ